MFSSVPCLVCIVDDAVSVGFTANSEPSLFHAQWLWVNDPTYVHASSGQRTRSPSSFYGWKLVAAETKWAKELKGVDESSYTIPTPPPPPGCLLPVGSVYTKTSDDDVDTPDVQLLCVTWQKDGKSFQSYYDLDWLERCRYDKEALLLRAQKTEVHKGNALGNSRTIIEVDFDDLQSTETHENVLYKAMDAIVEHGAVLIRNAPTTMHTDVGVYNDDEAAVASLGHIFAGGLSHGYLYGDVFHVKSIDDALNIAYTSTPLPPHQDLGYYESIPGLQLLHCISTTGTLGGESTLIDAMAAATEFKRLAPDLFNILTSCEATFLKQRENADMLYRCPHIEVDSSGAVVGVRWSPPFEGPLCLPPDRVEDFFRAHSAFERMLDNSLPHDPFIPSLAPSLEAQLRDYAHEYTWENRLNVGDVLVFNNQRMLHGRRGFEFMEGEDAERHLVGCYTNMEETLSRYRVLRRRHFQSTDDSINGWYQRNAGNGSSGLQ